MIEKPMTLDFATSQKLVEQARRAGKVLSVFHNRRWDIDYLTVKSAIASGVFGKLINIESRLGQWSSCVGPAAPEYHPSWRNEAAFGGGGLYDWGSHFIDQIWQLMLPARPVARLAQLRGNVWTKRLRRFRAREYRFRQRRRRDGRDQHHDDTPLAKMAHRRNKRICG